MSMRRPVIAVTELDGRIEELARASDHQVLAFWAADCAERVLPYFETEHPGDGRPRTAIDTCREWARTGVFRMAEIREASLDAHAAAREAAEYSPARSAARAAGQAVATAHVPTHAIAAARYAATAVRDASGNADTDVLEEREWQYRRLLELSSRQELLGRDFSPG